MCGALVIIYMDYGGGDHIEIADGLYGYTGKVWQRAWAAA